MNAQTEKPSRGADAPEPQADVPPPPDGHPAEAFADAFEKLRELRELASYYLATRIDAIKLAVRNLGIYAALGILGLVVAAATLAAAVVLLLLGIAGAWAELFPRHPWLGDLITGVLVLIVGVPAMLIGVKWFTGWFRSKTIEKYESRQHQQRQQFGRDVRGHATAPDPRGEAH